MYRISILLLHCQGHGLDLASVSEPLDELKLATAALLEFVLSLDLFLDLGVVQTARGVPDDGGETEDDRQDATGHGDNT
jgi:hypothetical protein